MTKPAGSPPTPWDRRWPDSPASTFESICETCTFFQTSIEFRPTLLAQHDDAVAKGQTHRAELFTHLIDRTHHEAS